MNKLQLTASIVERKPIRYTPVGVPIINCTLQHYTDVIEVGVNRQVEFMMQAIAIGNETSGKLNSCKMGIEAFYRFF